MDKYDAIATKYLGDGATTDKYDVIANKYLAMPSKKPVNTGSLPSRAWDTAKDVLVTTGKAAVGLPQAVVGIGDIVSGGHLGKSLEDIGYRPQETQDILESWYSPEQQAANKAVQDAEGFMPTLKALYDNPSVVGNTIAESLPQMAGGLGIAKGAMKLAPSLSKLAAGAIGEGAITAGSNAESIRAQTPDKLLSPYQSALAAGSGALTGAITGGSGAVANKFDLFDINQLGLGTRFLSDKLPSKVIGSAANEGAQEALQSGQEQAATNLALDKPVGEGVSNAAALGLVTGAAMGGGGALATHQQPNQETDEQPTDYSNLSGFDKFNDAFNKGYKGFNGFRPGANEQQGQPEPDKPGSPGSSGATFAGMPPPKAKVMPDGQPAPEGDGAMSKAAQTVATDINPDFAGDFGDFEQNYGDILNETDQADTESSGKSDSQAHQQHDPVQEAPQFQDEPVPADTVRQEMGKETPGTGHRTAQGNPTHESGDGQPLWVVDHENNVFQDADGNEVVDDYATKIKKTADETAQSWWEKAPTAHRNEVLKAAKINNPDLANSSFDDLPVLAKPVIEGLLTNELKKKRQRESGNQKVDDSNDLIQQNKQASEQDEKVTLANYQRGSTPPLDETNIKNWWDSATVEQKRQALRETDPDLARQADAKYEDLGVLPKLAIDTHITTNKGKNEQSKPPENAPSPAQTGQESDFLTPTEAPKPKTSNVPRGTQQSLFDEPTAEETNRQALADYARQKDAKRQGDQAEPPPLFSDYPAMAGQADIADMAGQPKPKHSFKTDTLESFVTPNTDGKRFNVSVRDIDSGEFFPEGKIFKSEQEAINHAQKVITGKPASPTDIDAKAHEAATSPHNEKPEPTQAQKEAGNYEKGHINLNGFDITVENPKGSTRSGTDAKGKPWSVQMQHHYGYIKRTVGADNEQVDVFVGDRHASKKVYVVNQNDPKTGRFDEHKVLLGFNSPDEAKKAYLSNYSKGWKGFGSMVEMSLPAFKEQLGQGKFDKPVKKDIMQPLFVPKPKKQRVAKPTDELKQAIVNLGGIQYKGHADRAGFTDFRKNKFMFHNGKTAKTLDGMAEALNELGFNEINGENDLIEKLYDSLNGIPHYTPEGAMKYMEKVAAYHDDGLSQQESQIASDIEESFIDGGLDVSDIDTGEDPDEFAKKLVQVDNSFLEDFLGINNEPDTGTTGGKNTGIETGTAKEDTGGSQKALDSAGQDTEEAKRYLKNHVFHGWEDDKVKLKAAKNTLWGAYGDTVDINGIVDDLAEQERKAQAEGRSIFDGIEPMPREKDWEGNRPPRQSGDHLSMSGLQFDRTSKRAQDKFINDPRTAGSSRDSGLWDSRVLNAYKNGEFTLDTKGLSADARMLIKRAIKDGELDQPDAPAVSNKQDETKAKIKELRQRAADLRKEADEYNKSTNGRAVKNKGRNNIHETNRGGVLSTFVSPMSENKESAHHRSLINKALELTQEARELEATIEKKQVERKPSLTIKKINTEIGVGKTKAGYNVDVYNVTNINKPVLDALGFESIYFKAGVPQEVYARLPGGGYKHLFDGNVRPDLIWYIQDQLKGEGVKAEKTQTQESTVPKQFSALENTRSKIPGVEHKTKAEAIRSFVADGRAFGIEKIGDPEGRNKDERFVDEVEKAIHDMATVSMPPVRLLRHWEDLAKNKENGKLDAAKERISKNDYSKPYYALYQSHEKKGSTYQLSKLEYDYAQHLIAKDETPSAEPAKPIIGKNQAKTWVSSLNDDAYYYLQDKFGTGVEQNVRFPTAIGESDEPLKAMEVWQEALKNRDAEPKAPKPEDEIKHVPEKRDDNIPGNETADDTKPYTLATHTDIMDRLEQGDISADEYKAALDNLIDSKDAIIAELNGKTKDALLKEYPWLAARYRNEKKDYIVDAAYRELVKGYWINGGGISYGMGKGAFEKAIKAGVEKTTDADLKQYAEDYKKAEAERKAAQEERQAGMENPQTLDDYTNLLRSWMKEGTFKEAYNKLTPEQRETYDQLYGETTRSERKARADQQKTDIKAVSTTSGDIIETKHTKTGEDLFVVKAAERVERDTYNEWNTTAKRLGGWYSSYRGNGAVPGFQFKTRENAEAFLKYLGGDVTEAKEAVQARRDAYADDKSQSAVERLTEMADRLEDKADEELGRSRKENTAKRAREAASAIASAERSKALAKTMRNIAKAIESDQAKFLDRVRQKVQVEYLQGLVNTAQRELIRERYKDNYGDYLKHEHDPATKETADHVTIPTYTLYRSDWAALGRQLLETDGTKKIGQSIMKVADDVTDAYLKFAKENLHKITPFYMEGGGMATFATKQAAEMAIWRSNYHGKAIALTVKRGENVLILSPSEAIKRGYWDGDQDKKISMIPDFGAEIVEKLGKINRRKEKVRIPWQLENTYDNRKRLAGMGLENNSELRAAIREFIGLQETPAQPSKVKEMERAMVGRRSDGLDFFPTPAGITVSMVETADIKDGMSVLEPSAGMGHIAERIREAGVEPEVVEISPERRELLEAKGFKVVGRDFMDLRPGSQTDSIQLNTLERQVENAQQLVDKGSSNANELLKQAQEKLDSFKENAGVQYDRIIMNPPFSDRRDMAHVQHAYDLLKPGGRLVAIMGEGVFFGQDKKAQAFRDWLEEVNGTDEKLEEGTFKDPSLPVTTGAAARLVVISKPEGTKYSKGNAFQGSTVNDINAKLPAWAKRLQAAGLLEVVQSHESGAEGFYRNGKITLVADQVNDNNKSSVLLHEAYHYGKENDPTLKAAHDKYLKNMQSRFKEAARGIGSEAEKNAYARVIASETPLDNQVEEFAAYLVSEFNKPSNTLGAAIKKVISQFIAAIRAALVRMGVSLKELSAADLSALAKAGTKFTGKDTGTKLGENLSGLRSAKAERFYSALKRAFINAPDKIFGNGKQLAAWLNGNAAKLGVKADEIYFSGVSDYLNMAGKVSRDDVLNYLAGNGVQVEDVMLGDNPNFNDGLTPDEFDEWTELYRKRQFEGVDSLSIPEQSRYEELGNRKDAAWKVNDEQNRAILPPKYGQYAVPGGIEGTYQELLLTLPEKRDTQAKKAVDDYLDSLRQKYLSEDELARPNNDNLIYDRFMDYEDIKLGELRNKYNSSITPKYQSSHWEQTNVLAHTRFDERTDAEGNKTLFVHEIQSDYGQEGKKKGFAQGFTPNMPMKAIPAPGYRSGAIWEVSTEDGRFITNVSPSDVLGEDSINTDRYRAITEQEAIAETRRRLRENPERTANVNTIPPAPFVQDTKAWVALTIKKLISHAVDNGIDKIAFINGEQAADLYDLRKQVKSIEWSRNHDDTFDVQGNLNNGEFYTKRKLDHNGISEIYGKEIADKITSHDAEEGELRGIDLAVGGTGMRKFYDSIVPSVARDIAKRMGGEVGTAGIYQMPEGKHGVFSSYYSAYEGRVPTQDEIDKVRKLVNAYGDDYKHPYTGERAMYPINRVANANPLRSVENAMKEGVPFIEAMGEHGTDELASFFGGKIVEKKHEAVTRPQNVLTITTAMREKVERDGMPLFSKKEKHEDQEKPLIRDTLYKNAMDFRIVPQTRTQWHKDFPNNHVDTPIGTVKLGENQFDKMVREKRGVVIGLIKPTLEQPTYIIKDDKGGNVYIRAFKKENGDIRGFASISYNIDGIDVVISNHQKDINNLVNKISVGELLYPQNADRLLAPASTITSKEQSTLAGGLDKSIGQDDVNVNKDNTKYSRPQGQPTTAQGFLKNWLDKIPKSKEDFIYGHQDRYIRLKRQMEKVVRNGGRILEKNDPYMAEELYHQRAAYRIKQFYNDDMNPILLDLHKAGISMDKFQQVLHARHAPERNATMAERNPNEEMIEAGYEQAKKDFDQAIKDKDAKARAQAREEMDRWNRASPFKGTEEERQSLSGMSNQEAARIIAGLSPKDYALLNRLGNKIDAITKSTLDLTVSYGMETRETIDKIKGQWQHYVPLYRDEAHPDNFTHPIGRGFSVKGSGIKSAVGSSSEVTNILAHIAQQREQMLRRGEKNLVTVKLANFIAAHPDESFAEVGKVPTYTTLVNGFAETLPDPIYKNRDNVVMFRVRGKDVGIVFNEHDPENVRLALSLKNMDGSALNTVERVFAYGTRWLAAVNTQYNLVFAAMNLMRDTEGALLNLTTTPLAGKQAKVFMNIGRAIKAISAAERGWSGVDPILKAYYDSFNKNGGTTGYAQMFDNIKDRSKGLQKEMNRHGHIAPRKALSYIIKGISDINTVAENSVRLAVYITGVESGLSEAKSASLAKNISVNFNRKGAYTTNMGAFYAFYNASIQGTTRMTETLTGKRGRQIMMGGVAVGAALAWIGIAAMGADDWDKIPEFVKERSLIVPAFGTESGYIAIPLPLGFNIFPNMGRIAVESLYGSNRIKPLKRYLSLAGTIVGAFNPMGGSDLTTMMVPTNADIPVAIWRNKDWTDKAIYMEDFSNLDPTPGFKRAKNTSPEYAKKIAEIINQATGGTDYKPGHYSPTPDEISYIVGQLGGGTLREMEKAVESFDTFRSGEELPTHKIPLLGRLYGNTKGLSTEKPLYYDTIRELNMHENEIKGLQSEGKDAAVEQYMADHPESLLYVEANYTQSTINKLYDQKKMLQKAGEKTTELDGLIAAQMKQLNDDYLKAVK